MKKLFLIIFFCLLSASFIEAEEKGIEIRPLGNVLIETEPKRVVTTVFRVTGKVAEKQEYISDVKLPDGWVLITGGFPFELGMDESDVKLVSFFIPQSTLAGKYEVTYAVKGRKYPSISDYYTINVRVLPVTKLEVKLLEAPEYVIAGEHYQASFVIINESNVDNRVGIKVESAENLPFIIDTRGFQLGPGESRRITVSIKTDSTIRKALRHRLRLTALIPENEKVKAEATSFAEIIPRITGVEDRFQRIPVEITFRQVTEKNEKYKSGFQTEISGEGALDEGGKRHLKFLFSGPDIQDKSTLNKYDEYFLSYWTEDYEFHFGDRNYSLSPLTENNRYGRGAEGRLNLNNFSAGTYYMETRWMEPDRKEAASYINYLFHDKYRIGLNYLKKKAMKTVTSQACMDSLKLAKILMLSLNMR